MVTYRTVLKLMVLICALGVSRITATSTTTYSTNTASTSTDSTNTASTTSVPTSTTSVTTSTTSVTTSTTSVPTSTSQTTSTTATSTGSTNTATTTTAASTTTTSTTTTTPKIDTKDFKLSLKVNMNVSSDFSNSSSPYYIKLKENCTDALTKILNETVRGLKSVTVTNLTVGSLIIDFTVVVNTAENPNPQSNFSAVVASIKTGITIGGELLTISTDVCDLLRPVCTALSQTCVTDSNGKASCTTPKSSANDIRLIVGLVVGLPLFASWWTFSY